MLLELRRSFRNKWFVLSMLIVVVFSFLSAYFCGWRSALFAPTATDLTRDGVCFVTSYYGNTFRVWSDSFLNVQMLLPVLVGIPYLLSYSEEKENGFRNYVISRSGLTRYVSQKTISIALAGSLSVTFGQILFYIVSYFRTIPSVDYEIVGDLFSYNTSLFYSNPYLYFLFLILLRFVYYFALTVFSVGVTSFFKAKAAILTFPFLLIAILDMVPLAPYTPYETNTIITSETFTMKSYCVYVAFLLLIGVISLIYTERKRKNYG